MEPRGVVEAVEKINLCPSPEVHTDSLFGQAVFWSLLLMCYRYKVNIKCSALYSSLTPCSQTLVSYDCEQRIKISVNILPNKSFKGFPSFYTMQPTLISRRFYLKTPRQYPLRLVLRHVQFFWIFC